MKRKHIVLIAIAVALVLCIGSTFIVLSNIGYSSAEKLMWMNPKVRCYKIYTLMESNDRILVVYKGNSANKSEIIYEQDDRYYLYDYDTKSILWEHLDNGALVVVREVKGKYTIEISGVIDKQTISSVSDSLNSDFIYQLVDYGSYTNQKWFVAIDEIPDDYYILIDDTKIFVPTK